MKHLLVSILVGIIAVFGVVGIGIYIGFLAGFLTITEILFLTAISIMFGIFLNEATLHNITKNELKQLKENKDE